MTQLDPSGDAGVSAPRRQARASLRKAKQERRPTSRVLAQTPWSALQASGRTRRSLCPERPLTKRDAALLSSRESTRAHATRSAMAGASAGRLGFVTKRTRVQVLRGTAPSPRRASDPSVDGGKLSLAMAPSRDAELDNSGERRAGRCRVTLR